ncbi:hypothetical protein CJF42_08510 [Pseudoalteromonas sp. NBT06-2]|uniref:hypothetical protein n=1 Tax=Pseudoalteromonas sp. NBT06-2 TaxID=2025950 RepID=UPI000BA62B87|nr:hypothetical protein [Pseudoalteromonas sp. NBT06-2]PAJ74838.1 hypothetical protein CJF42_08510 [Pseudoalteromonas sp. NBT06-2]
MTSAIGYGDITDKTGDNNHYLTWDTSVKFGFFSDISIYGEVGLDLFTRLRQIDGHNWQAKEHLYSGLQLSISF